MNQTKRALISVTDKRYLEKFQRLTDEGWEVISTGGTARTFSEKGVPCRLVEDATGFPEMMDGRLKTLHPLIFGGILAKRSSMKQMKEAADHDINLIDLVVINLYDFDGKPGIENIDIGGPSGIRAAGKNCESVTVVVDPDDYDEVIDALLSPEGISQKRREELALKAFEHTAAYDAQIARWWKSRIESGQSVNDGIPASH